MVIISLLVAWNFFPSTILFICLCMKLVKFFTFFFCTFLWTLLPFWICSYELYSCRSIIFKERLLTLSLIELCSTGKRWLFEDVQRVMCQSCDWMICFVCFWNQMVMTIMSLTHTNSILSYSLLKQPRVILLHILLFTV